MSSSKLLTIGSAIAGIALSYYFFTNKKQYYTTPNGTWNVTWDAPTVGTPPISYKYSIADSKGNIIANSTTSSTSILLDKTLFTPDPQQVMSDKTYTATIIPTNSTGDGPKDVFTFRIYDTPSIVSLSNQDADTPILPSTPPGSIFTIMDGTGPNTVSSVMALVLADRVVESGLSINIVCNGQTITPYKLAPINSNSSGQASQWNITWGTPQGNYLTLPSGQTAALNISATNAAGTYTWSSSYTVPVETYAPGAIDASAVYESI